jgi:hypothetical protein
LAKIAVFTLVCYEPVDVALAVGCSRIAVSEVTCALVATAIRGVWYTRVIKPITHTRVICGALALVVAEPVDVARLRGPTITALQACIIRFLALITAKPVRVTHLQFAGVGLVAICVLLALVTSLTLVSRKPVGVTDTVVAGGLFAHTILGTLALIVAEPIDVALRSIYTVAIFVAYRPK